MVCDEQEKASRQAELSDVQSTMESARKAAKAAQDGDQPAAYLEVDLFLFRTCIA